MATQQWMVQAPNGVQATVSVGDMTAVFLHNDVIGDGRWAKHFPHIFIPYNTIDSIQASSESVSEPSKKGKKEKGGNPQTLNEVVPPTEPQPTPEQIDG